MPSEGVQWCTMVFNGYPALWDVSERNEQQLAFLGLHKVPPEQRKSDPFQQVLRGFLELADKDLRTTLAFAREHGVALPGTGLCQQLMARVYGVEDELRR